jgi:hypothetical protein
MGTEVLSGHGEGRIPAAQTTATTNANVEGLDPDKSDASAQADEQSACSRIALPPIRC